MRSAERPPAARRYDAAVLERRCVEWTGGRAELETLDVAGRRAFELCQPRHVLSMPLDGAPRVVLRRHNGGPAERLAVAPGQVACLPAGDGIVGFTEGRGVARRLMVLLEPEALGEQLGAEARRAGVRESVDLPGARLRHLLAALAREVAAPGPLGLPYLETLGVSIGLEVLRQAPQPRRPGGFQSASVRRVTDYIESHLGDDLSLVTLAGLAGLSLVHFAREFKRATGLSPHRYVLARRVARAKALLARGDGSLTAIALAVGFSSQSHLTTAFGQAFGTTPAAYRRQHVGGTDDPIGF